MPMSAGSGVKARTTSERRHSRRQHHDDRHAQVDEGGQHVERDLGEGADKTGDATRQAGHRPAHGVGAMECEREAVPPGDGGLEEAVVYADPDAPGEPVGDRTDQLAAEAQHHQAGDTEDKGAGAARDQLVEQVLHHECFDGAERCHDQRHGHDGADLSPERAHERHGTADLAGPRTAQSILHTTTLPSSALLGARSSAGGQRQRYPWVTIGLRQRGRGLGCEKEGSPAER